MQRKVAKVLRKLEGAIRNHKKRRLSTLSLEIGVRQKNDGQLLKKVIVVKRRRRTTMTMLHPPPSSSAPILSSSSSSSKEGRGKLPAPHPQDPVQLMIASAQKPAHVQQQQQQQQQQQIGCANLPAAPMEISEIKRFGGARHVLNESERKEKKDEGDTTAKYY